MTPVKGSLGIRILMLATDAHGGFGGISQYNRDVLAALSERGEVARVDVVVRLVHETPGQLPAKVVYDPGAWRGAGGFLAAATRFAVRGAFDVVYCGHVNLMPVAAMIGAISGRPVVLQLHGIEAWQRPARLGVAQSVLRAAHLVSVSRLTLERFRSWSGTAGTPATVVANAIRLEDYGSADRNSALIDALGLRGRKVLMTLGRMVGADRAKGFDEVIEALPALRRLEPRICYVAAGDGPDRPRLQAKAAALGVADLVVFPGRLPESTKADTYRLADAYVMPSRGEGFGFVVIEALACGIPVVASAVDGTREATRDGLLGLLVDPADQDGLCAAVMQALARPRVVPPGLDHFAFPAFAARLWQVFADVTAAGAGSAAVSGRATRSATGD